jgi:hypothetical protein
MTIVVALRLVDDLGLFRRRVRRAVGGWWDGFNRREDDRILLAELRWLMRLRSR